MIGRISMNDFPAFMKNPLNRIDPSAQTPGVEGYLFDGADGSQMAHWRCDFTGTSSEHVHEFDEYFVVVEGCYTHIVDGQETPIGAGQECFIPRGVAHSGRFVAGTRTIHAFGGHRANRAPAGSSAPA
jgi:mannose-6-phosphate isomerase-like protein (cupin superfamily)